MLHCICQSTVCSFGFPLCYLPATLPQRDKRHLHPQPDTRSPSWTAIPVFHCFDSHVVHTRPRPMSFVSLEPSLSRGGAQIEGKPGGVCCVMQASGQDAGNLIWALAGVCTGLLPVVEEEV
jgi:hypothetical protein